MTELILIRHGETDWNRELRFQGQVDAPLNATGLEQARRVAQRLLSERFGGEHLVCSDLLRTRQTAEPAAQALLPHLSLDAVADPGLREQNFGIVDGLRVQDVKPSMPRPGSAGCALRPTTACPVAKPPASSTPA